MRWRMMLRPTGGRPALRNRRSRLAHADGAVGVFTNESHGGLGPAGKDGGRFVSGLGFEALEHDGEGAQAPRRGVKAGLGGDVAAETIKAFRNAASDAPAQMEALSGQQSGGDQAMDRGALHADPFFGPPGRWLGPVSVPAAGDEKERIPGTHGLPLPRLRFPLAVAGGDQHQCEVRQFPSALPAEIEVLRVARLRVALSGFVGERADRSKTATRAQGSGVERRVEKSVGRHAAGAVVGIQA